ncbi:MAG: hypothetical protein J0M12_13135 [Deltaproteobacteria bacterium]|nr:hypothetical protein [Deltaproteobacteria bacterium]
MKKLIGSLAIAGMLAVTATSGLCDTKNSQLPGGAVAASIEITATVTAIDYKTRMVTLQGEDGKTKTLHIGKEARNFDQVKAGDKVHLTYLEAFALDVQRDAGGELANDTTTVVGRAPKGAMPAGVIAETTTLRASVESIDHATRHVTLVGPEGNTLTLKVGEGAKHFNEIKKGDKVVATLTEALAISVTKS